MTKQPVTKKDDDLLELATGRLKTMPIPEMPLHGKQRLRKKSPVKHRPLVAACWVAVAASVLIAIFVFQQDEKLSENLSSSGRLAKVTSEIIEVEIINPNELLDGYLVQLDQLEQELDQLKQKARLLDARRKAEQLASLFAMANLTDSASLRTLPE